MVFLNKLHEVGSEIYTHSVVIHRSYKVQLDPNNVQKELFAQHAGCARWTFNWALNIKKHAFDNKEKIPNYIELSRRLTQIKKTEAKWLYDSSSYVTINALRNCDQALQNFFTRCKKNIKGKKGFPKFKCKKDSTQSFRLNQDNKHPTIKIHSKYITLPKIGKVKLYQRDYIPKDYKILSATISKRADKWFVSVNVEAPDIEFKSAKNDIIGVDLGIKNLATCSDGTTFENPKALKKNLKKLKRKQRNLSRKKLNSKNYIKTRKKLALLHYRISNIRKDCLHKITSKITDENQVIVLENLKVKNMMKNHNLAQAISDVGLFEFRRQIEYKAKWKGRSVIFADTFYPSSKLCSCCGWKDENLLLKDREFKCPECGLELDRDLNASLNLLSLAGVTRKVKPVEIGVHSFSTN